MNVNSWGHECGTTVKGEHGLHVWAGNINHNGDTSIFASPGLTVYMLQTRHSNVIWDWVSRIKLLEVTVLQKFPRDKQIQSSKVVTTY